MSSTTAERPSPPGDPSGDGRKPPERRGIRRYIRPRFILVPFIPITLVLEGLHLAGVADAPAAVIFVCSALGVVPTADLMGKATEELAERAGPGIGGLLNVTFGNFPELVIAFFALIAGLQEVVKASIVGSVLGNSLLVLGASMLVGGLRYEKQSFNSTAARAQSTMLLLALVALIMPAMFELIRGGSLPTPGNPKVELAPGIEVLSFAVAVVLIGAYVLGLIFSLKTHRSLFNPFEEEHDEEGGWSVKFSVGMLALAGAAVAVMAEILVGSIEVAAESVGLSQFFIGVVIVAVVGNAAEHWVAVLVAAKNKMDLAINIAIGSSAQVALFVAPVLVLLSFAFGPEPLALVFSGYELGALIFAVVIGNFLVQEGESNWFEGAQLLSVYLVLCIVFFLA